MVNKRYCIPRQFNQVGLNADHRWAGFFGRRIEAAHRGWIDPRGWIETFPYYPIASPGGGSFPSVFKGV